MFNKQNKKRKQNKKHKRINVSTLKKITLLDVKRDLCMKKEYIKFIISMNNKFFSTHSYLLSPWLKLKYDEYISIEDRNREVFLYNINCYSEKKRNRDKKELLITPLPTALFDIIFDYVDMQELISIKCKVKQLGYNGVNNLWYEIKISFIDVYNIKFSCKYTQLCHYLFNSGGSYNDGFNHNFNKIISEISRLYSIEQINVIISILHYVYYNIETIMNNLFTHV